ncbi:MAG: hypothetical protein NZ570_05230, partial [Candidatus Caldarchaeum sp.]|nr:hypothetical protein [Candidatus Caldarchaeum sp.]
MDGLEFVLSKPWTRFYDKSVNNNVSAPKIPLPEFFEQSCETYREKIAAVFLDTPATFEQLNNYVKRFSTYVAKLGLGKG